MSIPDGGYSRAEFLSVHGYSEKTLKALRKCSLAPKETLPPESKFSRITKQDYLSWLDLIAQQSGCFANARATA